MKRTIVVTTANVFGNLSRLLKKIINGRAIKAITAAMAMYTNTDFTAYKNQHNKAIPKRIASARKIPLAKIFEVMIVVLGSELFGFKVDWLQG